MDMAVANLFKHKAIFNMKRSRMRFDRHPYYRTYFNKYTSNGIENSQSIGVTDINGLCMKCLEPFMVYAISRVVVEETEYIDYLTVYAELKEDNFPRDLHEDIHRIYSIKLDDPELYLHALASNSEMTIHPIDTRLSDKPFYINISVCFEFLTPIGRQGIERLRYIEAMRVQEEEEEMEEEEYTPPIETYREDCCVVCLESKPNILYLDCTHIAICDSCNRLKKTHRKNCDVCRAEISKRVKI